jgi:nicotinamidase/pyrazinamidase
LHGRGGVSSEIGDRSGGGDHPERLPYEINSYSAFFENDRRTPTGLAGYLRDRGLRRIFMAGLATDYCVHHSAVDARRLGFDTVLVEVGCRAIDLAGSLAVAWAGMAAAGVQRVNDL